jgi:hypothetical protein
MKLKSADLFYCQNIHQTETLEQVLFAISTSAVYVKKKTALNSPFCVGLRISDYCSCQLQHSVEPLSNALASSGMYAVSINGFPYGRFKGPGVKKSVYYPDWGTKDRLFYTKRLATILSHILPHNAFGTISTIPVCYGKLLPENALEMIMQMLAFLKSIYVQTGKKIILCFEPEPNCFCECTSDVVRLWEILANHCVPDLMRFAGICLDTCHFACVFEKPLAVYRTLTAQGIAIPKIQLSSALSFRFRPEVIATLGGFFDPVYLHQVSIASEARPIEHFEDLTPELVNRQITGEWRVHFHVPLYYNGSEVLSTTSNCLTEEFLQVCFSHNHHVEIETYSYGVLPQDMTQTSIEDAVCREYAWVISRVPAHAANNE